MTARSQLLERARQGWLGHLIWEGESFEIEAEGDGTFLVRPGTIGSVLKVGTTGEPVFFPMDGPRKLEDDEILVLFEGILLAAIHVDGPWRALTLPTDTEVRQALDSALLDLLENDYSLLTDDVNERTITARLAHHLEKHLSEWHLDCEYNRAVNFHELQVTEIKKRAKGNGKLMAKMLFAARQPHENFVNHFDLVGHKIFPDIIVHRRQSCCNLLVIEAKKNCGPGQNQEKSGRVGDISKLKMMKEQLGYRFGVFVSVATGAQPSVEEVYWIEESPSKPGGPLCYASIGFRRSEPQFASAGEGPANISRVSAR